MEPVFLVLPSLDVRESEFRMNLWCDICVYVPPVIKVDAFYFFFINLFLFIGDIVFSLLKKITVSPIMTHLLFV